MSLKMLLPMVGWCCNGDISSTVQWSRQNRSRPNVVTLGIRIGAFEKGRRWHHALWILFHGPHKCLVCFSLLFQVIWLNGATWINIESTWDHDDTHQIQTKSSSFVKTHTKRLCVRNSLIALNSAITACEKCEKWQHALMLLNECWHFGVQADVVSFSAAISACSRCEQWERSLDLLHDMMEKKMQLNVGSWDGKREGVLGQNDWPAKIYRYNIYI